MEAQKMPELLSLFNCPQCDEPFISESALHNIKLPAVLRLCMSEEQADALSVFIQRPSDMETILNQQSFFKEFLYSDTLVDLFKKTQNELLIATQLVEQYEKEKSTELRHFLFYRLMEVYLTALTDIADMAGTAQSSIMSAFIARVKTFCQENAVEHAMQDMGSIRKALKDVTSQSFEVRLYGSFMTDYDAISTVENAPTLDKQLHALFSDIGMSIAVPPPNKEMKNDMFNTYFGLLIKNNKQVSGILSSYYTRHKDLFAHIIPLDISDISTIISIHTLFDYLNKQDIPLCFPGISPTRVAHIYDCHDLSLLTQKIPNIVPNDFICNEDNGIFILTGINSGGKTTYLRGIGIAIAFFASGLFVPATSATIPYYDHMEALFAIRDNTRGGERFLQEKQMVNDAMARISATSLLLVNEIFSSIDEKTALAEYSHVIRFLQQKACHCLLITHLHSLARGVAPYADIVSLVAMIGENSERLYKIKRSQGRSSNVLEILQKYALTPAQLTAERSPL